MSPYPYGDEVLDWLSEYLKSYEETNKGTKSNWMKTLREIKITTIKSMIDHRKKEIMGDT